MKYMITHYASQAGIGAMPGKETAADPPRAPEEVRATGESAGRWTDELVESSAFVDAAGLATPVPSRKPLPGEAATASFPGAQATVRQSCHARPSFTAGKLH
jgi:hypothetical protein